MILLISGSSFLQRQDYPVESTVADPPPSQIANGQLNKNQCMWRLQFLYKDTDL